MLILKSSGTTRIPILLTDPDNNEDAVIGKAANIVARISKNGGTFNQTANAPVEIGRGWYYVILNSTETNTEGPLIIEAEAPGLANIWRDDHQVYASFPGTLSTTERNAIADTTIRRNFTNVFASSVGDSPQRYSLLGAGQRQLLWAQDPVTPELVYVKKPDGNAFYTMTITYAQSNASGATSIA